MTTTVSVSIDVPSLAQGVAFYCAAFGFVEKSRPVPGVAVLHGLNIELCLLEIGAVLEPTRTSPRHPGGMDSHYAPRTPAQLVFSYELDKAIAQAKGNVAVLAFSRPDERVDYWLRMPRDPRAYAQKLYAALRELDTAECEEILVEAPPEAPEWAAVRDRLQRACG